jgi:glutathione peroxidase
VPRWNFQKYLIAPDGSLAGARSTRTEPMSDEITTAVEDVPAR